MNSIRAFVAIVLAVLTATSVASARGLDTALDVSVGVFDNPPIVFHGERGEIRGIAVDVLNAVASAERWRLHYLPCQWPKCLELVEAGELDILPGVAFSEERAKRFAFNQVPLVTNWGTVLRKRDRAVVALLDLNETKVAVVRDAIHTLAFERLLRDFAISWEPVAVTNYAEAAHAVADGRADAAVVSRLFASLQQNRHDAVDSGIVFNPIQVRYVGARGMSIPLLDAIDRHLRSFKLDEQSTYHRSIREHISPLSNPALPAWIWWSLLAVSVLAGIVGSAAMVLRRQVNLRTAELVRKSAELELEIGVRLRTEEELNRRGAILEAVSFVARRLLDTSDLEHECTEVLERLALVTGVNRIWVAENSIQCESGLRLRARYCWPSLGPGRGGSIMSSASVDYASIGLERWPKVLGMGDAVCGPTVSLPMSERNLLESQGVESLLVVPVFVNRHWWGFMRLDQCEENRAWSSAEIDAVKAAAEVLGTALARMQTDSYLRQSATVFESAMEAVIVADLDSNIVAVNRAFTDITGYHKDEVLGKNPRFLKSGRHETAFFEALWTEVWRTGRWQGEIWNRRKCGKDYPSWMTMTVVRDAGENPTHFVAVASDITTLKESEAQLAHQAHHDALTGLPNRLLLQERLANAIARAQRLNQHVAVLFLDLDRFKNINDSLGHSVGDELLRAVADRLRKSTRKEDTVSRLAGDEFVVVLEGLVDEDAAETIAAMLLSVLSEPFRVDEQELYLTVSIGLGVFPRDGEDVMTLVKHADAAMYHAKDLGRNNFQSYTQQLTSGAPEQLSLENDLRQALERNELVLHYQPQVELCTGRLVGAEALIRWQHPRRGLMPPNRFVGLAEQTGLINPIGEWVVNTACRQLAAWDQRGLMLDRIAVNISGFEIRRGDVATIVRAALDTSQLAAVRLELEINEDFIMRRTEHSIAVLDRLKQLGVVLSIDDFGTGQASLSYLKRLPIDRLKIDQAFVRHIPEDTDDEAIVRAIIALAHSLRLQVVAEGVESPKQLDFLLAHECDEAQGYFFGEPMWPDDFLAWAVNHESIPQVHGAAAGA